MAAPLLAAGAKAVAGTATKKTAQANAGKAGIQNVARQTTASRAQTGKGFKQLQTIAENPNVVLPNANRIAREKRLRALIEGEEATQEEMQAFLEADELLRIQQQQASDAELEAKIKTERKTKQRDFFARLRLGRRLVTPWTGGALIVMYILQILFFAGYVIALILIDTSITDIGSKSKEQILLAQAGNETLQGIAISCYYAAFFFGFISIAYFYALAASTRHVRPLSGLRSVGKWLCFIAAIVGCFTPLHIIPSLLPWIVYTLAKPA